MLFHCLICPCNQCPSNVLMSVGKNCHFYICFAVVYLKYCLSLSLFQLFVSNSVVCLCQLPLILLVCLCVLAIRVYASFCETVAFIFFFDCLIQQSTFVQCLVCLLQLLILLYVLSVLVVYAGLSVHLPVLWFKFLSLYLSVCVQQFIFLPSYPSVSFQRLISLSIFVPVSPTCPRYFLCPRILKFEAKTKNEKNMAG